MMKYLFFWVLLLLATIPVASISACDVCGGSGAGNAFGLLPGYNSRFFGIRYQFRYYKVEHPPLFQNELPIRAKNQYHNSEIWGRYGFLRNRLQIYGALPFSYNVEHQEGSTRSLLGFGDAQIILQGVLINNSDSADYKVRQTLLLGTGVKIPTGTYKAQNADGSLLTPGLQLGTGSFDFPLSLQYTIQYRKVGLNLEGGYRINTKAANTGYRFGNRATGAIQMLYRQQLGKALLLPYFGLQFEHRAPDYKNQIYQAYTKGTAVFAGAGAEIFLGKTAWGFNVYHPVWQHLGGGYIQASWQAQCRFLYLF